MNGDGARPDRWGLVFRNPRRDHLGRFTLLRPTALTLARWAAVAREHRLTGRVPVPPPAVEDGSIRTVGRGAMERAGGPWREAARSLQLASDPAAARWVAPGPRPPASGAYPPTDAKLLFCRNHVSVSFAIEGLTVSTLGTEASWLERVALIARGRYAESERERRAAFAALARLAPDWAAFALLGPDEGRPDPGFTVPRSVPRAYLKPLLTHGDDTIRELAVRALGGGRGR